MKQEPHSSSHSLQGLSKLRLREVPTTAQLVNGAISGPQLGHSRIRLPPRLSQGLEQLHPVQPSRPASFLIFKVFVLLPARGLLLFSRTSFPQLYRSQLRGVTPEHPNSGGFHLESLSDDLTLLMPFMTHRKIWIYLWMVYLFKIHLPRLGP